MVCATMMLICMCRAAHVINGVTPFECLLWLAVSRRPPSIRHGVPEVHGGGWGRRQRARGVFIPSRAAAGSCQVSFNMSHYLLVVMTVCDDRWSAYHSDA